ncbi:hypothetical protein IAD21_00255 [Abditibacteriota bacterium]|nr:hypothetical protein IAD21_00255 [Abditibacteriota bacterium]
MVIMKRFAWLWGALLGAVLFPVLMVACNDIVASHLPLPSGATLSPANLPSLLQGVSIITRHYGGWGAGVGCCGAMLWIGNRSLKWRLLSIGVGIGAVSYLFWQLWTNWHLYSIGSINPTMWAQCVYAATSAPLILGALLLLFFALLLRSSGALVSGTEK